MATKNLIPREDGEGGIGITGTSWGSGVFNTGLFDSVGIGTTGTFTPDAKLEILDSSEHLNLKVPDTISQSVIKFSDASGVGAAINFDHNTDKLHFITDGSVIPSSGAFNIDSSGNVGIGTATPVSPLTISKFHTDGTSGNIDNLITLAATEGSGQNLEPGDGVGILFKVPVESETNHIGARIAGVREGGTETASSTELVFEVSQNDETLDEAMRIDRDGNVGIGTASPDLQLDVNGGIQMQGDQFWYKGGAFRFIDRNAGSSAERMRIDSLGNIGIGTTSPEEPLDVRGAIKTKNTNDQSEIKLVSAGGTPYINLQRGSSALGNWKITAKGNGSQQILSTSLDTSELMVVQANGNVGIGTTSPPQALTVDGNILTNKTDVDGGNKAFLLNAGGSADEPSLNIYNKSAGDSVKISSSGIELSGVLMAPDENERIIFGESGIMVGQAEVRPDPDNPESIYFQAIPQVKDSEGNAVTVLTADKLGLGTTAVLESAEQDLQFKLLTDQQRFVVGTTGDYGLESGWYRFNDFKVKGATDIGSEPINPVDTRIYSDESSFVLFKTDTAGNRVAHLVGGSEEVSPNNAIALGIAVKVDDSESPQDIEFVHTDGESYSVVNGNSDSLGTNGLPIRQGFQNASLGCNPLPLLIDGGSF